MKLTKILLSLFILTIAVSCGDDDDATEEEAQNTIVGTYDLISFEGEGFEADIDNGVEVDREDQTFFTNEYMNATITFTESGRITSTGSFLSTVTYRGIGFTETEVARSNLEFFGSYTVTAGNLTIDFDEDVEVVVTEFTPESLKLNVSERINEIDYRYEVTARIELQKQ